MPQPCPPLPADDLEHVLGHTRVHWETLRGQRIFITGGTGFFGMWLLETFAHANSALELGAQAVVLTRDPAAFARKAPHLAERPDLVFVAGDIRNFEFPGGKFKSIIHAATAASAKLNDEAPEEMLDVIIAGTRHVLRFAEQAGVEQLLLTSSGAVYGPQPTDLTHVSEDYSGAPDPLIRSTAYGQGKRISEHLCAVHAARQGYQLKLARCFAFVGPHLPLDAHFAIGNFIRDALNGGPIRVAGDGTPLRSYLYAADLAIWLWTILVAGAAGRAYNVGSDQPLSIADLAHATAALRIPTLPVEIARPRTPDLLPARYVPAIARAQKELGLRIHVNVRDALARTYNWHSQTPTA